VIVAGADLEMDFTITDSGHIEVVVDVPSVGGSFRSVRNFYSRRSALTDYSKEAVRIREDAEHTSKQISEIAAKVGDSELTAAREKIQRASALTAAEADPEVAKQAADDIQEAKRLLAEARKTNLVAIRRAELDTMKAIFEEAARQHARPTELASFERLTATAESLIGRPGQEFEARIREMQGKIYAILARQDWFVVDRFKMYADEGTHLFTDRPAYEKLVAEGQRAISADDMERLRTVVTELDMIRVRPADADDLISSANIVIA
jgi:molecular chaperone DnaK